MTGLAASSGMVKAAPSDGLHRPRTTQGKTAAKGMANYRSGNDGSGCPGGQVSEIRGGTACLGEKASLAPRVSGRALLHKGPRETRQWVPLRPAGRLLAVHSAPNSGVWVI